MSYSKPSEFLRDLDSHSIYLASMLDECDFDVSTVPVSTGATQKKAIEERGLGGYTTADFDESRLYFTGWTAAAALARQFLGEDPGARFQGRGSAFRASLAGLEAAGH